MAETRSSIMANMEHAKDRQKTLERIQSEVRGSKTLYEASAIAQEKQVFPKNLSQAVKTNVTPPFEIKAKNYSSLNKVLMKICLHKSLHKIFEENQHILRSAYNQEIEMANISWIKYLQKTLH